MGKIKFRPGRIVMHTIHCAMMKILNNEEFIDDCLNEKRCIHFAPNADGEIELHVQKNSDGLLECDICHRKIYKRFDQSAIDIIERCMDIILSRQPLALVFANLLYSSALIGYEYAHVDEFYQARYVIVHVFTKVRSLLNQLIAYVVGDEEHEPKPTNDSNEEPETDTNDIQKIEQCISVVDQILIFGLPNGLRENAQDELLIFRSALLDLVENLENSDDE